MDDQVFSAVQRLAADGDTGAMVEAALEFRARGDRSQAFAWLLRAGDSGNPRAMAALAIAYRDGDGVEADESRFLLWVERAAKSGDPGSMVLLAEAYRTGRAGLIKDPKQMLAWLFKAIRAGSAEAMRLLADAYALGMGVGANALSSFEWYERAARAGDVTAMLRTADSYLKGRGVNYDPVAYFKWMNQAAERGEPVAMFNLANAYDAGLGTEEDKSAFIYWLTKAAEQEYPAALFALAIAYRDGHGVNTDQNEYFRLLGRASAAGDPRALNTLAINHLYGFGVPVDQKRYWELLTEAAQAGDADAMFNLAHAYRDGVGVAKNSQTYLAWLVKASKLKQLSATVELAAYAYRVALAERGREGAAPLHTELQFEPLARQAADLGDGRAMYLLAMAHRAGVGVVHNWEISRQWLERAAQAGFPTAMAEIAMAYRRGAGYAQNDRMFFEWIRKAAEAGEVPAMTTLALAYHDGRGTERSLPLCRTWLERAEEHGEPRAFLLLGLLELEALGESKPEALRGALESFMTLQSEVLTIKKAHIVHEAPQGVGYFTTLEGLAPMISGGGPGEARGNRLRLYNAAYLDDPGEGSRLLDVAALPAAGLLREFFTDASPTGRVPTLSWNGHEYCVYVASFSLRNDHFDLWRTYGHDGEGCCVVTPLSAFRQEGDGLPLNLVYEAELAERGALPEESRPASAAMRARLAESHRRTPVVKPVLYRVEYDTVAASEVLERLRAPLEVIAKFKQQLKKGAAVVDALVRILVSDILYLFKAEIYQAEQEARILVAFDLASSYVKSEVSALPAKLYVETEPFLFSQHGSRIIIGPNVTDCAAVYLDLRYRLARNQWSAPTEVEYSTVRYR